LNWFVETVSATARHLRADRQARRRRDRYFRPCFAPTGTPPPLARPRWNRPPPAPTPAQSSSLVA